MSYLILTKGESPLHSHCRVGQEVEDADLDWRLEADGETQSGSGEVSGDCSAGGGDIN